MGIIATTNTEHYENIADSIRYSKDGTQLSDAETYTPSELETEVQNLAVDTAILGLIDGDEVK